jgi:hypothetical protein
MPAIIKLQGGLGNQLFQYAHGLLLRNRYSINVYYDTSFYYNPDESRTYTLDRLDLPLQRLIASRWLYRSMYRRLYNISINRGARTFSEDEVTPYSLNAKSRYWFEGYWQDIPGNADEVVVIAQLIAERVDLGWRCHYEQDNDGIVAVHVRRGDYINVGHVHNEMAEIGLKYYMDAVQHIKKQYAKPLFVLFSDDIEYLDNTLGPALSERYVIMSGLNDEVTEFLCMASCDSFIIANSTYSWWASRSGIGVDKVVVAPSNWFKQGAKYKTPDLSWVSEVI